MTPETTAGAGGAPLDPFAGGALLASAPTTDAQREVLSVARLGDDANLAYNETTRLSLTGQVDVPRLLAALDAVHRRHEALRSTFSRDDEAFFVWDRALAVERRTAPLGDDGAPRYDLAAFALQSEPFDLDAGPLFRAVFLDPPAPRDDGVELVLCAHHLVCDGWSLSVLVQELFTLYRDPSAPLDPAPRFVDYAARERAADPAAGDAYWARQFEGSVPRMALPSERRRAPARSYAAERIDVALDDALVARVRRLASQQQVTFFAALFAGAAATLGRLCQDDDVVLAVPSAGQASSGMAGLVGHCVNVLPVRLVVDAQESAAALVRRAGARLLDAQDHAEYTLGRLLRTVAIPREAGRVPVTPVMFNLDQGLRLDTLLAGTGLRGAAHTVPRKAEYFELFFNLVQHEGKPLVVECQFNARLFSAALVREWIDGYAALLGAMADAAERPTAVAEPIGARALECLATAWQGGALREPCPATVHGWIVRTAEATPDAIAVRDGDGAITYRELVARAATIARRLQALGAQPGARVALSASRGVNLPAAMLGVMMSGAAYVPLDIEYPVARLRFMLDDSAPIAWIVDGPLPDGLDDGRTPLLDLRALASEWDLRATPPTVALHGERDAVYVIHTSGSTGRPKGVVVPHAAVTNLLASMRDQLPVSASDRVLAITTLSFDIAALELLLPLTLGGSTCLVDRDTARDPRRLAEALRAFDITVMQATPSTWRMLLDDGWSGSPSLLALCGGEALAPDLAARLRPAVGRLWNVFGPTETTIWSTMHELTGADAVVPIGRPLANTHVEIVDAREHRTPIGVPGEILIGGRGVALGYHARPELTRERFVEHPLFGGARAYRTGDLGAWRPDGTLQYLGRMDGQVKLRGHRVELGEIEAGLVELPEVAAAGARLWDDTQGDARIAAYVVPAAGTAPAPEGILQSLRMRLPAHMLPQHIMVVPALPLTPNGKLDRQALPEPAALSAAESTAPESPAEWSETERVVAEVWREVLGTPVPSRAADFFQLGGHSILVVRAVSRLEKRLGVTIGLRRLFEQSRLDAFARAIPAANVPTTAFEEITL